MKIKRINILRVITALLLVLFILTPAMAKDVKIGVFYDKTQSLAFKDGADFQENYRKAVEENGGKLIELFITDDNETKMKKLKEIDGLIVPGGADVDPALYGEGPYYLLEEVDLALDAYEYKVIVYCLQNKIPIMGICRGHQIMNVFLGGTMIQDIPTQHKSSTKVHHRKKVEGESKVCFHKIKIEEGSLLNRLLKKNEVEVNSLHHQAVKDVSPLLKVDAKAEDGIVEAAEGTGDSYYLGVQFHPERLRLKDPSWNVLFKALINAAAERQKKAETKSGK